MAGIDATEGVLLRSDTNERHVHQQILYSAQQTLDKIDPLKITAISHAEAIGRIVREQLAAIQTLVNSTIQVILNFQIFLLKFF